MFHGEVTGSSRASSRMSRRYVGPAPAGGVNGINEATCIIVSGVSVHRNMASCGGTRLLVVMG